ncbi:hypothetical protein Ndes2526B_g04833 [Nannochloris sp. 'desiccata']
MADQFQVNNIASPALPATASPAGATKTAPSLLSDYLPISILTDSYKATHFLQYPEAKQMVAYGEFRTGYENDATDTRLVWYGIRYIIEQYVMRQWTLKDIELADAFYSSHMAPTFSEFPYPREIFVKFIIENNGYMPVKIESLPEGSCIHAHVPVFQITSENEYAPLCTFLETLLVHSWYPATVATLSRRCKDIIAAGFEVSVEDGANNVLLASRLHDFGFRGCTGVEQSVLGGVAHLLNFTGTDTLSAAYYAQFAGIFASVMDSYDYQRALDTVVPSVAAKQVEKGGFWVLRPDSGIPEDAVVAGLRAAEAAFGADVNSKGYKVPRGVGVIQGDGICIHTIKAILDAVHAAGYSAASTAFGMGGGLLQKVNRDTMSFAVKLNNIVYADGTSVDKMKAPRDDHGKDSLPGVLAVKRVNGVPTVFPAEEVSEEDNMLQIVYNCGPVEGLQWETFDQLRERVEQEWGALPKTADVVAESLKKKRTEVGGRLRAM